jgi:hypothetical protein
MPALRACTHRLIVAVEQEVMVRIEDRVTRAMGQQHEVFDEPGDMSNATWVG